MSPSAIAGVASVRAATGTVIVTPRGLPAGMSEVDVGSKTLARNPRRFSTLYRMGLVEQIGSGIRRIRDACAEYGVAEALIEVSSDWVTVTFPRGGAGEAPHVTPHVERFVAVLQGDMSRAELIDALGLADRDDFAQIYLQPGIDAGLIEMTVPDRPRSLMQRYRLTGLGRQLRGAQGDRL